MIVIANILVIFFISVGVIFTVAAVIGVLRLPDVYTRSHAATQSVTFGVLCTLLGVFLYFWLIQGVFNIEILLGIIFLFITAPIGGHILARAAYFSGVTSDRLTVKDDLKEVVRQKKEAAQADKKDN